MGNYLNKIKVKCKHQSLSFNSTASYIMVRPLATSRLWTHGADSIASLTRMDRLKPCLDHGESTTSPTRTFSFRILDSSQALSMMPSILDLKSPMLPKRLPQSTLL